MRPPLAPLALALCLAMTLPTAAATVRVEDVDLPERTMAGKPFALNLTLRNDGAQERFVHLFAALYDDEEPGGPCGPAAGPRFRTFTHLVQETIRVPAGGAVRYPDADDEWLHLYGTEDVGAEPSTDELCIFVANASSGTPQLAYDDFESLALPVRGVNALPVASFAWTPERPEAAKDVRFEAEASDADGDPVTFLWDFGYVGAQGRARGAGATPSMFFFPAGEYVVTLRASDGLEVAESSRTITVVAAGAEPPDDGLRVPAPALLAIAAIVLAAARRSDARRR